MVPLWMVLVGSHPPSTVSFSCLTGLQ